MTFTDDEQSSLTVIVPANGKYTSYSAFVHATDTPVLNTLRNGNFVMFTPLYFLGNCFNFLSRLHILLLITLQLKL
jgi:hypothetical protein